VFTEDVRVETYAGTESLDHANVGHRGQSLWVAVGVQMGWEAETEPVTSRTRAATVRGSSRHLRWPGRVWAGLTNTVLAVGRFWILKFGSFSSNSIDLIEMSIEIG
jgi:hypothetical protein